MSGGPARKEFVSITIQCKECGEYFEFSAGEQEFYAAKELHEPKRCRPCRIKIKLAKGEGDKR